MSNIDNGREAIKEFMKANNISEYNLAITYGRSRAWIQRVLDGKDEGPAVSAFILEVTRDHKTRWEASHEYSKRRVSDSIENRNC